MTYDFRLNAEYFANPYAEFDRLRQESPFFWSEILDGWVALSFEHAQTVVNSRDFIQKYDLERLRDFPAWQHLIRDVLANQSVEEHQRLRKIFEPVFSKINLRSAGLRSTIEELTEAQLATLDSQNIEFTRELFYPIPALVIARLLDFPVTEPQMFYEASHAMALAFDPESSPEVLANAERAILQMLDYCQTMLASPPKEAKVLHSILAENARLDSPFTHKQIAHNLALVFFAGHETTSNMLGLAALALEKHPQQKEQLISNLDTLMQPAIEELLRYDTSVQLAFRYPTQRIEVAGQILLPEHKVFVMRGAAHRDPEKFAQPEKLDWQRQPRHIAFAGGAYTCLGMGLARLEMDVILRILLKRGLRVDPSSTQWRPALHLRGMTRLVGSLSREP